MQILSALGLRSNKQDQWYCNGSGSYKHVSLMPTHGLRRNEGWGFWADNNLSTFITKTHESQEATLAKRTFPYVDKWLLNKQINQKLSNHFGKNVNIPDTQITQTLKFRFAQYTGNHRKNIFWPLNYPNPNCTLCRSNDRDTWPHLLYFDKCW